MIALVIGGILTIGCASGRMINAPRKAATDSDAKIRSGEQRQDPSITAYEEVQAGGRTTIMSPPEVVEVRGAGSYFLGEASVQSGYVPSVAKSVIAMTLQCVDRPCGTEGLIWQITSEPSIDNRHPTTGLPIVNVDEKGQPKPAASVGVVQFFFPYSGTYAGTVDLTLRFGPKGSTSMSEISHRAFLAGLPSVYGTGGTPASGYVPTSGGAVAPSNPSGGEGVPFFGENDPQTKPSRPNGVGGGGTKPPQPHPGWDDPEEKGQPQKIYDVDKSLHPCLAGVKRYDSDFTDSMISHIAFEADKRRLSAKVKKEKACGVGWRDRSGKWYPVANGGRLPADTSTCRYSRVAVPMSRITFRVQRLEFFTELDPISRASYVARGFGDDVAIEKTKADATHNREIILEIECRRKGRVYVGGQLGSPNWMVSGRKYRTNPHKSRAEWQILEGDRWQRP